jgi:tetratricopeptide (TPR) repeat protein
VKQQPDNGTTWNFIGMCENGLGNSPKALESYKKARELDPKLKEAVINTAQAYRDLGMAKEAEIWFSHVALLSPC